jgi:TMEM175 potassium channel family protein
MTKTRLEAFSDGVLAIIVTIMVLEIKVPHEATMDALLKLWPVFISYLMSFVFIGIYWGNHHHLLHTVHHVNGNIIWSNMHLLFWLSLVPFTTGWMGENHFEQLPVALYSINLLLCAIAFYFLQRTIMKHYPLPGKLVEALKKQEKKGYASLVSYVVAVITAFIQPAISGIIILGVAIIWIIPDRNIEKALRD